MQQKGMVLLVGEQPAPNLLPAKHERPGVALLVYTSKTERIAKNLRKMLESQCRCHSVEVDAYHIPSIERKLEEEVSAMSDVDWAFNVTGGTKAMAIAALGVAQRGQRPVLYFQTEGPESRLYRYAVEGSVLALQKIDVVRAPVTIHDLLQMHLGTYTVQGPKDRFEEAVAQALQRCDRIDERMFSVRPHEEPALEIDFIVRCRDRFGVGEVKAAAKKASIDQLQSVAEPRHLGTYIAKFLISGAPLHWNNKQLARAYRIDVIETCFDRETGRLEPDQQEAICGTIVGRLCGS